jgi:alpha-N-arabinofuranosidase
MARQLVVLLALAFQSAAAPAAQPSPQNLLRNGGLEEAGPDRVPAGFGKVVYGAQPEIAFDAKVFKEGRQSMRVSAREASDTAIAQDVDLKPETAYCFSGWVRTQDLVAEDRSWTYGTFQIQDPRGRLIARLGNHKGTTDWTREKVCFLTPPDGKVHVVCFFVGFGKGTGTAWFDDLRLEQSPAAHDLTVTAKRLQHEPISPMIYGNFMELLSNLVPAMWAEKLDGTSFEFLRTPAERELHRSRVVFDPKVDPHDRPWRLLGKAPQAECELDADRPFNGQVSQRIGLREGTVEAGIAQDGIFVEKGESYRFTGHFRQRDLAGPVEIELRRGREVIARDTIGNVTGDWTERHATLTPTATTTGGTFVLRIATPGTVWVDRVSLMPAKTIAGWRPDAVAAIRAMKPGVIRWGGSIIESYSWRDGTGAWQRRAPFPNRCWGRVDPNVVGIDEFIAFCRATAAEPLICVRWSGQKPSDAAEMVEYCNGPVSRPLGALRARNGHPEPYGVKFWQIGNEVSGAAYDASFAGFARAMRKADPSIKIFASYISENLLKDAADLIDFVCPHQYACADLAGTEAETRRYADLLNRFAPGRPIKLAVTEWNTTAGDWGQGRHTLWTLANGLDCARYLNLCHRWSDLVKIACRSNMANSYCSGILQTNNHACYGTPAWHVAKLYAEHGGAHPLVVDAPLGMLDLDVSANLSADGKSLSLIAVNPRGKPLTKTVHVDAFAQVQPSANVWTIADADQARDPEATNSFERPERIAERATTITNAGKTFSYTFPPYSVTLIRLCEG